MAVISKTIKEKPKTTKPKANPRKAESYRSLKDGEVKLTAEEKRMAELVAKAIS